MSMIAQNFIVFLWHNNGILLSNLLLNPPKHTIHGQKTPLIGNTYSALILGKASFMKENSMDSRLIFLF